MRKSSVHFEVVKNATTSILHSERDEETEPAYLLPKEFRLGNAVVPGSMSNIAIGLEFAKAKESMTGQAKARGSSPFWEGVIVLDGTDLKAQTAALQSWKKEYEKLTGQCVLHMAIHRDEGFVNSEGKPEYNIHAHVIVNRMNDKGRVIKLERKGLSEVQDMTAKVLGMERGETLEDRKGMRGRKHMNHREFRKSENEKRLDVEQVKNQLDALAVASAGELDKAKSRANRFQKMVIDDTPIINGLQAQLGQLKTQYDQDRATLKASGEATLRAYQALKVAHEQAQAELKSTKEKGVKMDEKQQALNSELAEVKAKFATMAKAYEAHKVAGLPAAEFVPGAPAMTPNEAMGVAWWNRLVPGERRQWLAEAKSAVPADAWAAFQGKNMGVEGQKRPPTPDKPIPEPTKTAQEPFREARAPTAPTPSEKTTREAFMALYDGVKVVLVGMIDGFRLDAAEGRMGLFSAHQHGLGRVEVLCEVPRDKVMPNIGEVFDCRAVPGKGKGGKGD